MDMHFDGVRAHGRIPVVELFFELTARQNHAGAVRQSHQQGVFLAREQHGLAVVEHFARLGFNEELSALDPENAADYRKNAEAYDKKLADLDAEYEAAVADASYKTLLFADRFPFRYLVDDYGLQYYAAFSGCSAETEASFETIAFLSGKLGELELGSVMVIETSDQSIARTVIGNSGADREILVMDSMQSVTAADVSAGYTYLAAMEKNLEALKGALK